MSDSNTMMTNCLARPKDADHCEDSETDKTDSHDDIPPLRMTTVSLQTMLRRVFEKDSKEATQRRTRTKQSTNHTGALQFVDHGWDIRAWQDKSSAPSALKTKYTNTYKSHLAIGKAIDEEKARGKRPHTDATCPKASLYNELTTNNLRTWLHDLQNRKLAPNNEQLQFLKYFVAHIETEAQAEQQQNQTNATSEPIFDMVHGLPGAGKSQLIAWMRETFEQQLGWTHGVQFVCVAFQNATAAHMDGYTIHHWTGIDPFEDGSGTSGSRNIDAFSKKCKKLRFLLVDEISMVSAQLLYQINALMTKVAQVQNPYRCRSDKTERPFGGVNTFLFGDWWQLRPVKGTALFDNPYKATSQAAFHGLQMLWGEPPNSVHRCWNFTKSMRCKDIWYNDFLNQCRVGSLSADAYNTIHGYPTGLPITLLDKLTHEPSYVTPDKCTCPWKHTPTSEIVTKNNLNFYGPWAHRFLTEGATGAELLAEECSHCKGVRSDRTRILTPQKLSENDLDNELFRSAPALFACNAPRYYTSLLRTRKFARAKNEQLHWAIARDIPLTRDDRDKKQDDLDDMRFRWLLRHNQTTCHIASQIPLASGLPVRLTDAVDTEKGLFRGRRGHIVTWVPHQEEKQIDVDGEVVLTRIPPVIYVHFPSASWKIGDLDEGVYPLTPKSRTWEVNRRTRAKVRRTGYFLEPDFASTSHMIQGQSLDAYFADLVYKSYFESTTEQLHVSSYVMLSRAKYLTGLWLMQPFGYHLFTQGPPIGPHLLLKKLQGLIDTNTVEETFKKIDATTEPLESKNVAPLLRLHACAHCLLSGRQQFMKPAIAFNVFNETNIVKHIVSAGAWARCAMCETQANEIKAKLSTSS